MDIRIQFLKKEVGNRFFDLNVKILTGQVINSMLDFICRDIF